MTAEDAGREIAGRYRQIGKNLSHDWRFYSDEHGLASIALKGYEEALSESEAEVERLREIIRSLAGCSGEVNTRGEATYYVPAALIRKAIEAGG